MSPVCFDNKPVLDNSSLTASVTGVCPTAALSGFDFFYWFILCKKEIMTGNRRIREGCFFFWSSYKKKTARKGKVTIKATNF